MPEAWHRIVQLKRVSSRARQEEGFVCVHSASVFRDNFISLSLIHQDSAYYVTLRMCVTPDAQSSCCILASLGKRAYQLHYAIYLTTTLPDQVDYTRRRCCLVPGQGGPCPSSHPLVLAQLLCQ